MHYNENMRAGERKKARHVSERSRWSPAWGSGWQWPPCCSPFPVLTQSPSVVPSFDRCLVPAVWEPAPSPSRRASRCCEACARPDRCSRPGPRCSRTFPGRSARLPSSKPPLCSNSALKMTYAHAPKSCLLCREHGSPHPLHFCAPEF